MTKEFCDRCFVEIINDEKIRITFSGTSNKHFLHKNVQFCDNCFGKIDEILSAYIPRRVNV